MPPARSTRFSDQKDGFRQILSDRHWLAKVLLGGFLLINPLLIALAPDYFGHAGPAWVARVFPWILGFNVLSFWFPLGFTYEVLRRARTGRGPQLPDWSFDCLAKFAREGSVKLVLAIFTLLLPAAAWMGACYGLFIYLLGLPVSLLCHSVLRGGVLPLARRRVGTRLRAELRGKLAAVPARLEGLPAGLGVHRRRELDHDGVLLHDSVRRRVRAVPGRYLVRADLCGDGGGG
jgi:hypothetical protein